jgi:hypothetical protein
MSTVAWRAPADRMKARSGWLEGPVLGVQCRPETDFGRNGSGEAESVLDTARELGGLLLLAQERLREGKRERKSGEGKWWVTKARWGGGPGGEVGEASGGSDAPVEKEEKAARSRPSAKDKRKLSAAEAWKVLKPGGGIWDPRIAYEAIGKDRSVEWDEASTGDSYVLGMRETFIHVKDRFSWCRHLITISAYLKCAFIRHTSNI